MNHDEKLPKMISDDVKRILLPQLFNAAVKAGAAIMKVYRHDDEYDIGIKSDMSPITVADRMAHNTIKEALGATRIPILSEEGREMLYDERRNWDLFWLVDPLDGTVEFIKGNNEFTVNIALMENNECVASAVYVPWLEKIYIAGRGTGSFVKQGVAPDPAADYSYDDIMSGLRRLPLREEPNQRQRIAVSRSHQTPETGDYIRQALQLHPDAEVVEQGSSYKFCLLAEGSVDYYVRTTRTYEWDTAAGELILAEAGGTSRSLPDNEPFRYNKEDLSNPWFVCKSKYSKI